MSELEAVLALQAMLLATAWLWRGGNDRLVYGLAAAFVAAAWAGLQLRGIDRQVMLGLFDAGLVSLAAREWIARHDLRGWSIGWLGLFKIGWRFAYASHEFNHWIFAAMINATFIAQVIIAGGMADGLGTRIADHLRRAGPRRARLLRNVAGR